MQYIMQPQVIPFELCTLIKFHSRPFSKSLNLWEEFINVVGLIFPLDFSWVPSMRIYKSSALKAGKVPCNEQAENRKLLG